MLEGAAAATNLPPACCDAIFMRDVYHHITEPEAFNKSLAASLKPGGRLAVIDFPPDARLEGLSGSQPQPRRPRHSAGDRACPKCQQPDSRM